jgi:hypothetical protein
VLRIKLALFLLLIAGGGLLWWIQFSPNHPSFSLAQYLPTSPGGLQQTAADADKVIAQGIRSVAEGGIELKDIFPLDLNSLSQATLSAEVAITPEELWRQFRERGSRAVLDSVAENVEWKVNDVSAATVNEARYQYCKGVVETYEKSR